MKPKVMQAYFLSTVLMSSSYCKCGKCDFYMVANLDSWLSRQWLDVCVVNGSLQASRHKLNSCYACLQSGVSVLWIVLCALPHF